MLCCKALHFEQVHFSSACWRAVWILCDPMPTSKDAEPAQPPSEFFAMCNGVCFLPFGVIIKHLDKVFVLAQLPSQ